MQPNILKRVVRTRYALALAAVILIGLALVAIMHWRSDRLQLRLLAAAPEAVAEDPALLRFATQQAKPLYALHCAACHGPELQGNPSLGAPNLADDVWLYGDGSIFAIERTLLYGIRSGEDKSHNDSEMPAFGQRGTLSDAQIRSVVQYLLQLSGRPYEAQGANEGRALYTGVGVCGDCHGADGQGNPEYGAPDLTRNVWNSGGDAQALYNTIYFGQHRIMPAWGKTLSLEQIRALATYVYAASHAK